jgi:hypothetical protein
LAEEKWLAFAAELRDVILRTHMEHNCSVTVGLDPWAWKHLMAAIDSGMMMLRLDENDRPYVEAYGVRLTRGRER